LNPLENVKKAFIPAFFIVGNEDDFVIPEHTKKLYDAYAGEKKLKIITDKGQGHNSTRPKYVRDSIAIFFYQTLQVQALVKSPIK
jgi:PhoPQ-activated pathogenicity-related protein